MFSKVLSPEQQRYGATERELLGAVETLKKFKKYLCIKPFDLIIHCRPIV